MGFVRVSAFGDNNIFSCVSDFHSVINKEFQALIASNDFHWYLCVPNQFLISSSSNPISVHLLFDYGESIADEWKLVDLIFKLSSQVIDCSFTVIDEDGEFILSECAHVIPKWASPDNCINRVFIRDGSLRLVPKYFPASTTESILSLELIEALNYLKDDDRLGASILPPNVQKILYNRFNNCTTSESPSNSHKVVLALPRCLAKLIKPCGDQVSSNKTKNFNLIPGFVSSFYPPPDINDPSLMFKNSKSLVKSQFNKLMEAFTGAADDIVLVSCTISRLHYARLANIREWTLASHFRSWKDSLSKQQTILGLTREEILHFVDLGIRVSGGLIGWWLLANTPNDENQFVTDDNLAFVDIKKHSIDLDVIWDIEMDKRFEFLINACKKSTSDGDQNTFYKTESYWKLGERGDDSSWMAVEQSKVDDLILSRLKGEDEGQTDAGRLLEEKLLKGFSSWEGFDFDEEEDFDIEDDSEDLDGEEEEEEQIGFDGGEDLGKALEMMGVFRGLTENVGTGEAHLFKSIEEAMKNLDASGGPAATLLGSLRKN